MRRLADFVRRHRAVLALFAFCWCWFSLLSSGSLGVDTRNRLDVARNMLAGRGPVSPAFGTIVIDDGGEEKRYTRYHLGQSLLLMPVQALVLYPVEKALPPHHRDRLPKLFLAVAIFALFSAMGNCLLFQFLRQLGISVRNALLTSLAIATCTPFLWYGASTHETSQIFLLLVASGVLALHAPHSARSDWCAFAAGVMITVVTWFKPLLALDCTLLLLGYSYLMSSTSGSEARRLVVRLWIGYAVGAIISLALFTWDNWNRFGHLLRTPYQVWFEQHGIDPFSIPLWKGFAGQTVSLDFGLLWICPIAFLLAYRLARRIVHDDTPSCAAAFKRLMLAVWASYILSVLVHGSYSSYAGSHAFGPRFQMHLIPFLCLPLAVLKWNRLITALLVFGFAANMAAKFYPPGLEIHLRPDRFAQTDFIEQAPFEFPGIYGARMQSLGHALSGHLDARMAAVATPDLRDYQMSLTTPDFWYVIEFNYSAKTGLLASAVAVMQLIALLISAVLLRECARINDGKAMPTRQGAPARS